MSLVIPSITLSDYEQAFNVFCEHNRCQVGLSTNESEPHTIALKILTHEKKPFAHVTYHFKTKTVTSNFNKNDHIAKKLILILEKIFYQTKNSQSFMHALQKQTAFFFYRFP